MTDRLSDDAQEFISRALGAERAPNADELTRIRRGVLAATAGAGTVLASGSSVALGGKALGTTLVGAAVKGIVLGAVVTVGASSVSSYLEPKPAERESRSAIVAPAKPNGAAVPQEPREAPVVAAGPAPELTRAEPGDPVVNRASAPSRATMTESPAKKPHAEVAPRAAEPEAAAALASPTGALGFELEVLRRAQAELRAERGAAALRILDENAGRLAGGRLGQERLAVEVLAACQTGQLERARLAARRFHTGNAATPAAARIRASCVGHEVP
jgi:hypothetical protein